MAIPAHRPDRTRGGAARAARGGLTSSALILFTIAAGLLCVMVLCTSDADSNGEHLHRGRQCKCLEARRCSQAVERNSHQIVDQSTALSKADAELSPRGEERRRERDQVSAGTNRTPTRGWKSSNYRLRPFDETRQGDERAESSRADRPPQCGAGDAERASGTEAAGRADQQLVRRLRPDPRRTYAGVESDAKGEEGSGRRTAGKRQILRTSLDDLFTQFSKKPIDDPTHVHGWKMRYSSSFPEDGSASSLTS